MLTASRRGRRRLVRGGAAAGVGRRAAAGRSARTCGSVSKTPSSRSRRVRSFAAAVLVGSGPRGRLAGDRRRPRAWAVLRGLWKAAVWGNDRVADGSEKVLTGLGTAAKAVGQGREHDSRKWRRPRSRLPRRGSRISVSADTRRASRRNPPVRDGRRRTTTTSRSTSTPSTADAGDAVSCRAAQDEPPANADYELPPLTLLNDPDPFPVEDHEQKLRDVAALLEKTFLDFGMNVKVVGIHTGPVITQYEVALETGSAAEQGHEPRRRPRAEPAGAGVRVVAPAAGPQHGRHRGAQRDPPDGAAQGTRHGARRDAEGGEVQAAALPRQGRGGPPARLRPRHDAAPAHRRPHRHRQVGVPEHHHRQPAAHPPAGRVPDDPDRPEEGRTDRLRPDPAPDDARS